MKKLLFVAALLCSLLVRGQYDAPDTMQITIATGPAGAHTPALIHFPNKDSTDPTKYGVMIFMHGLGEEGGPASVFYNNSGSGGPAYSIYHGTWPTSQYDYKTGTSLKLIVVTPWYTSSAGSSPSGSIRATMVNYILEDLIARYHIDTTRMYLTGLSAGGQGVVDYLGNVDDQAGGTIAGGIRHKIACGIPMSAEFSGGEAQAIADTIFRRKIGLLPVGSPPDSHGINTIDLGYYIWLDSAHYTPQTVYSGTTYDGITYAGGHCCWGTIYDPTYTFSYNGRTMNMYQYALQYATAASTVVTSAYAGPDQALSAGTTSATLTGSGTPATGHTISTYAWSNVSGPNTPTFTSASTASTGVTGMISGTYDFRLTVTDNASTSASDDVIVTIGANSPPTASAGSPQTIYANIATSVTLSGSGAAVSPATSVTYLWTKTSGPGSTTITGNTTTTPMVSGLQVGAYVFNLRVTDNNGLASNSTVAVTVNAGCGGVVRLMTLSGNDQGKYFNRPAWNPGDTIKLSSTYRWTYFSGDTIAGTAACPLVIMNDAGVVEMTAGIAFSNAQHVHITGTGSAGNRFGFYIHSYDTVPTVQRGNCIQIDQKSAFVEIDHIKTYLTTYAAWFKTDGSCDTTQNYPHYHLDNLNIHDFNCKNINQDGFYIGSTSPNGTRSVTCSAPIGTIAPIPMRVSNIHVWNVTMDSVGRSGIQISGGDSGMIEMDHDTISRTGYEFNPSQGSGLIFGGYTHGLIHDNVVTNTFQHGIWCIGAGSVSIYNNIIDSSGFVDSVGKVVSNPGYCNISVDTRVTTNQGATPSGIPLTVDVHGNKVGATMNQNPQTLQFYHIDIGAGYQSSQPWGTGNNVCSNTLLDGVTAASYRVNVNLTYTICGGGPPTPPTPCTNCIYLPRKYILIH